METLADIKVDVKEILLKVGQLTINNQERLSQDLLIALPIKTRDSLVEAEEWLLNDCNYKNMVSNRRNIHFTCLIQ